MQCHACIFLFLLHVSMTCQYKVTDASPGPVSYKGFVCQRNEFHFRAGFFFCATPLCFSLCLFSRILVLISREVIVAKGRGWRADAVNALQTHRRRATKKATAYSKATVQLFSHAKHSKALCKGWVDWELRVDLSQASHLKHTQTKLGPLPLMPHDRLSFVFSPLRVCVSRKCKIPG